MIVRPSKGVHIVVARDRIESDYALILPTEKSVLFVLPWGRQWIIGTTDTDWHYDLDHPAATHADIQYLLEHANKVLAEPLRSKTSSPCTSACDRCSAARRRRRRSCHAIMPCGAARRGS